MTDTVIEIINPETEVVELLGGCSAVEIITQTVESASSNEYLVEILTTKTEVVEVPGNASVEIVQPVVEVVLYGGAPGISGVSVHNALSGIQGGATDDHQHLTAGELQAVQGLGTIAGSNLTISTNDPSGPADDGDIWLKI